MERMYQGSILCVASGCNSFCPKEHGSFRKDKHSPSSFNQGAVTPFNNSILLRSTWNALLMTNADTFIKLSKLFVHELRSIVSANEPNSFVESNLQLLDESYDDLRSFIL